MYIVITFSSYKCTYNIVHQAEKVNAGVGAAALWGQKMEGDGNPSPPLRILEMFSLAVVDAYSSRAAEGEQQYATMTISLSPVLGMLSLPFFTDFH